MTVPCTPTTSVLPPSLQSNTGVSLEQFAPVTVLLGLIVLIETVLLSIFLLVRYKKSHNRVSALHRSGQDSNMAGLGGSSHRTMLTYPVQNLTDSDSAVGTVSTISGSVGNMNTTTAAHAHK